MNLYRGGEPTSAQIISLISRAEWEADANLVRWLRDELATERTRAGMAVRGLAAEEERSAGLLAECRKLEAELAAERARTDALVTSVRRWAEGADFSSGHYLSRAKAKKKHHDDRS
jgi:hypothetical protein